MESRITSCSCPRCVRVRCVCACVCVCVRGVRACVWFNISHPTIAPALGLALPIVFICVFEMAKRIFGLKCEPFQVASCLHEALSQP